MEPADDSDDAPAFPLTIRIAGWLWVGLGVALLLGSAGVLAAADTKLEYGLGAIMGPLGVLLWVGGRDVVRGEVDDPIVPGVLSVTLGVPALAVLLYSAPGIPVAAHVLIGVPVTAFTTAGLLALIGRGGYLRWKASESAIR